jgi:hypothetical protein
MNVSTKRKRSTPADPAFRSARTGIDSERARPTGRPRKIVRPATAPRRRTSPSDTVAAPVLTGTSVTQQP